MVTPWTHRAISCHQLFWMWTTSGLSNSLILYSRRCFGGYREDKALIWQYFIWEIPAKIILAQFQGFSIINGTFEDATMHHFSPWRKRSVFPYLCIYEFLANAKVCYKNIANLNKSSLKDYSECDSLPVSLQDTNMAQEALGVVLSSGAGSHPPFFEVFY